MTVTVELHSMFSSERHSLILLTLSSHLSRLNLSKIVYWHSWWGHIWGLHKRRQHRLARRETWIRITYYHPRRHHRYLLCSRLCSRLCSGSGSNQIWWRCESDPGFLSQNSISRRSLLSSNIVPQSFPFLFLRQYFLRHHLLLH